MDQWKKRSWQLCRKSLFPHTPMVCRVSSLFLEHRRRTTLFSHQLSSECHSLCFDKSMYQQILRVFSCKIKGAFNMKQSYITFIELNVLKTYEDNKKKGKGKPYLDDFLDDSECLLSNSTFACLIFNNHPLLLTVDLETACPAVLGVSNTSICTVMPPRPTLCSSSCTCSASSTSSVVPTEIARSWSTTKTLPQVMTKSY